MNERVNVDLNIYIYLKSNVAYVNVSYGTYEQLYLH